MLKGVKIWIDAKVDFSRNESLIVAGVPLIAATGLGARGLTIGGLNLAGITLGTLLALVLNFGLSFGTGPRTAEDGDTPGPPHAG